MKSEHFTLPDFSKLDWAESFTPISCLYRIFDINVHYFGLQTLVERMVCNAQYKGTFQLIRQAGDALRWLLWLVDGPGGGARE